MTQPNRGRGSRPSKTFFHYTSRTAADKIIDTGYIRPSTDTVHDAMAGTGTYLTALDPRHSQTKIVENNYDSSSHGKLRKTNVAIEVTLPRSLVTKVRAPGRNVYVTKKDGLDLSRAKDVKVHVRDNDDLITYQWDPNTTLPVLNPNTYNSH